MSEGREKLSNFSRLKSMLGPGLKEKKARMQKARGERLPADNAEQASETPGQQKARPARDTRQKPSQQGRKAAQKAAGKAQGKGGKAQQPRQTGGAQPRSAEQSGRKRMPQYGQGLENPMADISQANDQEELVVKVDVRKQTDAAARELFGWLCRTFPRCFNPRYKKPLKIGINDDIQAEYQRYYQMPADPQILGQVLKRYVGDQKYQKAVLEHQQRYDLYGTAVESFSEQHLAHARQRLEELQFKADLRARGIDVRAYYEQKAREEAQQESEASTLQQEQEPASGQRDKQGPNQNQE